MTIVIWSINNQMEFYQLDQMRFISDSMVSLILKIILTFEEKDTHEEYLSWGESYDR